MSACRESICCEPDDFNFSSDQAAYLASQNCRVIQVATPTLPDGEIDTPYTFMLQAIGGVMPYAWAKVSGSLPNGLTLNENGTISGTPTESGDFTFTLLLSDSLT